MGARNQVAENEVRAERAFRTILGRYEVGHDAGSAITDLVTDLRHLCDQYAVGWSDVLARVDMHFKAEAQSCRACGSAFAYDVDADYCPVCADENRGVQP